MARDARDTAAEIAATAAEAMLEDEPRGRAPQAVRDGRRRMDPGDAEQLAWLVRAIESHCAGLPRSYGEIVSLTLYDGESPIAEFDGGGQSAHDVASFLVMRATLEGKRIALHLKPACRSAKTGNVSEVTTWRFFARPELAQLAPSDPDRTPGAWGGSEAIRLRDAHAHQLVQALITQNSQHATALRDVLTAQSNAMAAVAQTVGDVLKGIGRTVDALSNRVASAENAVTIAQADARDYQRALVESTRTLESTIGRAERAESREDAEPVAIAVRSIAETLTHRAADAIGMPRINGDKPAATTPAAEATPAASQGSAEA